MDFRWREDKRDRPVQMIITAETFEDQRLLMAMARGLEASDLMIAVENDVKTVVWKINDKQSDDS